MHVVGTNIPHTGLQHDDLKPRVWNDLGKLAESLPPSSFLAISGDLHTRLRHGKEDETLYTGPHVHNPQPFTPNDDNRDHAIHLCATHSLCFANTFKATKPQQRITYQEKTAKTQWNRPDPNDYATIDHTLLRKAWLPSCAKLISRPDIAYDSDHFWQKADIRIKTSGEKKKRPQPRLDLNNDDTNTQRKQFNDHITQHLQTHHTSILAQTTHSTDPKDNLALLDHATNLLQTNPTHPPTIALISTILDYEDDMQT